MKHTLSGVTPAKFAQISSMLKLRTGLTLDNGEGTVERSGFAVRYRFDSAAQVLEIELLKKPWYVPQSAIDREIEKFMAGAGKELQQTPPPANG